MNTHEEPSPVYMAHFERMARELYPVLKGFNGSIVVHCGGGVPNAIEVPAGEPTRIQVLVPKRGKAA